MTVKSEANYIKAFTFYILCSGTVQEHVHLLKNIQEYLRTCFFCSNKLQNTKKVLSFELFKGCPQQQIIPD